MATQEHTTTEPRPEYDGTPESLFLHRDDMKVFPIDAFTFLTGQSKAMLHLLTSNDEFDNLDKYQLSYCLSALETSVVQMEKMVAHAHSEGLLRAFESDTSHE